MSIRRLKPSHHGRRGRRGPRLVTTHPGGLLKEAEMLLGVRRRKWYEAKDPDEFGIDPDCACEPCAVERYEYASSRLHREPTDDERAALWLAIVGDAR